MEFFKSLWKSLYDVQYYHTAWQQYTFWKAVWRYTRLFFLISIILGVIGIVFLSKFLTKENIVNVTNTSKDIAIQLYPSWLVLDISAESGVVTNSTGPTIISMNTIKNIFSWTEFMTDKDYKKEESKNYDNLLVIDTVTTWTVESYNTILLLTKTQLIAQANKNEKRIYEIAEAMKGSPAIHITPEIAQSKIDELANRIKDNAWVIIKSVYTIISIIGLIILFFGSFFIGLFAAISIYFYALIIWILSKILKTEYSYKQIYSMTVLGFTLPFCLLFASVGLRVLIICIIVWRVMYLHNKKTNKDTIYSNK